MEDGGRGEESEAPTQPGLAGARPIPRATPEEEDDELLRSLLGG